MRRIITLLALAALTACDADPAPRDGSPGSSRWPAADSAFANRFLVLTASADSPVAALIELSAWPVRERLQRSGRGWLGSGAGWEVVFAREWRAPQVRYPGRVVPGGGIRVLIDDGGSVAALLLTNLAPALRLELGASLVPTDPDPEGFEPLPIRKATIRLGETSLNGAALQFRSATAATSRRRPGAPLGTHALFMTATGDYLAVRQRRDEQAAIVVAGPDGAEQPPLMPLVLYPVGGTDGDVLDEGSPAAWRVVSADSVESGRLEVISGGWARIDPSPETDLLQGVRGTIRLANEDRDVVGIIHVGRD
jgi:hypothetical protein